MRIIKAWHWEYQSNLSDAFKEANFSSIQQWNDMKHYVTSKSVSKMNPEESHK